MECYLLSGGIVLLLFLLAHERMERKKQQAQLREIRAKLEEIQDLDSEEHITVFTKYPEVMELAAQANRLLVTNRRLRAEFRRSEESAKKMLSNISHDMKTPMTVLLGYLEIMRLNGATEELLAKTEQKAQGVMELMNQFFTLAKLESGDAGLLLSRMDLSELCRESVLDFYEILTEQGFEVEAVIPEQSVLIQGNREALLRIINNLISNAIRYGAEGRYLGVCVRTEGIEAFVEVTDRGKGIDAAFAESVFERLFTMEDSRNRRIQGNGLGLTIARHLAEQMGGTLTLQSTPSVRTVFTLSLPLLYPAGTDMPFGMDEVGQKAYWKIGDCETGLVFDVQKRQTPDFLGDKQEK